jgi:hypothetical protein
MNRAIEVQLKEYIQHFITPSRELGIGLFGAPVFAQS